MLIGLVTATAAGQRAAGQLAAGWAGPQPAGDTLRPYPVAALRTAWRECDAVVCFLAVGATVRLLAPELGAKQTDPAVVCVDEGSRFAVAVLGGHDGGGNALAHDVAAVLGATPVVTTGSDSAGQHGLHDLGWPVRGDTAALGRALLDGAAVELVSDAVWPWPPLAVTGAAPGAALLAAGAPGATGHRVGPDGRLLPWPPPTYGAGAPPGAPPGAVPGDPAARIVVTDRAAGPDSPAGRDAVPTVLVAPPRLWVGVGASRGAPAAQIAGLVDEALAAAGLSADAVAGLASATIKADEPGLTTVAAQRRWPLRLFDAAALAAVAVPHPSAVVAAAVGTPSVAEAAALLAAGPGAQLAVPKTKSSEATVAVARAQPRGQLRVVGLGPGARDLLTPRARAALRRSAVWVGLDQYLDAVRDLALPGTVLLASGLGDEEARAGSAVALARAGFAVALVGSGDAGVYAMGSPALLALGDGLAADSDPGVDVETVPGVTAALAAAALLGAPLGHDHAAVSLSDLHTPWPVIERRVRAVAEGDLVVSFYNPRSRGRDWQLPAALDILRAHRPPTTPVGVVRDASRPGEQVQLTTLALLDPTTVDMLSTVVVGASQSEVRAGAFVTPRGYRWAP